MEFPNMENKWNRKVTKYEILKYLIQYKKQGYNHVTFLWWEPFIQWVFLDALILWKKLWFTILVTTNATTLHIEKQAKKYLPYIDELILSVQWINQNTQQTISRTKVLVYWEEVFENIKKHWNWTYFKANIVITQDNLVELFNMVKYLKKNRVPDIAITYPDIDLLYYWKEHLLKHVAPTYSDAMVEMIKIKEYCDIHNIHLKIVDFPFCLFPENNRESYITQTDDFDYQNRIKVWEALYEIEWDKNVWIVSRDENSPRERAHIDICKKCIYSKMCWWISKSYDELYSLTEFKNIKI